MAIVKRTILLIDDEPDQIKLLEFNLSAEGYRVLSARDGESGLAQARRNKPDLIILDVMMPGMDGWDVCKHLRQDVETSSTPILMLTAKAEETDRVLGLELGADDYVTKPFSVRELVARVKALFRRTRTSEAPADVVRMGGLVVDAPRRSASINNRQLLLTETEFNLLRALTGAGGRVLSRDRLITLARGEDVDIIDRTIDVHIASLRRKLGRNQRLLETIRGVGYRLRE